MQILRFHFSTTWRISSFTSLFLKAKGSCDSTLIDIILIKTFNVTSIFMLFKKKDAEVKNKSQEKES
jgi:hypothetical protein